MHMKKLTHAHTDGHKDFNTHGAIQLYVFTELLYTSSSHIHPPSPPLSCDRISPLFVVFEGMLGELCCRGSRNGHEQMDCSSWQCAESSSKTQAGNLTFIIKDKNRPQLRTTASLKWWMHTRLSKSICIYARKTQSGTDRHVPLCIRSNNNNKIPPHGRNKTMDHMRELDRDSSFIIGQLWRYNSNSAL